MGNSTLVFFHPEQALQGLGVTIAGIAEGAERVKSHPYSYHAFATVD